MQSRQKNRLQKPDSRPVTVRPDLFVRTKAGMAETATTTDRSIAEIAGCVGYDSQSKFSAAFKEAYQLLPKEYRKKYSP